MLSKFEQNVKKNFEDCEPHNAMYIVHQFWTQAWKHKPSNM